MNKNLEEMNLAELKLVAKELSIKSISKFKKSELIEEIKRVSPASIEKSGVVLREKYHPKKVKRTK